MIQIRKIASWMVFVVTAVLPSYAMAGHYGPNSGYSETSKDYTYNSFVFNANKFDAGSAGYEHETHVLDKRYANDSWYWETNLPSPAYKDCLNQTDPYDNFTIGSCSNKSIKPNYSYYTYYDLNNDDSRVTSSRVETWGGQTYKMWWCFGGCSCNCLGGRSTEDYVKLTTYTAPGWVTWRR